MSTSSFETEISTAEIGRLAQVRPATVSNWRRRHPGFPKPVGGTATRPLFSRIEVVEWLKARGALSKGADLDEFRLDAGNIHPQLPLAVQILSRLDDDEVAARLGVPPLPSFLKPKKIDAQNCVSKYDQIAERLASYPDPYPEVGRILVEKPHITAKFALIFVAGPEEPAHGATDKADKSGSPSDLVDFVAELASLTGTERVLDLAAGRADFLRRIGRRHPEAELFGFESDADTLYRASKFAAAEGVRLQLKESNAFSSQVSEAVGADVVFADGVWGDTLDLRSLIGDTRFPESIGVRQRDWAWVYLAIHHLSASGRGFVTLPATALQRGNAKGWRSLILQGCIEAVIALPTNLYSGARQDFKACLLIVRKPQHDAGDVLMMSAEKPDENLRELADAYRAWRGGTTPSDPAESVSVPLRKLAQDNSTLIPRRWLALTPEDLSSSELTGPVDLARQRAAELLAAIPHPAALGVLHAAATRSDLIALRELIRGQRVRVVGSLPTSKYQIEFQQEPNLIPVVTAESSTGLDPNDFPIRSYSYVSEEERAKIQDDSLMTRAGDVIISPIAKEGRVLARVVSETDPIGYVAATQTHLRILTDDLHPGYLALMLQSTWNAAFFTGHSPARFNVRDLEVPILPAEQQWATAEGFRELDEVRRKVESLATQITQLTNVAIDATASGRFTISKRLVHGDSASTMTPSSNTRTTGG